ncbi:transposase [Bacillus thuringiensis]|uniref:transposase n=1 Tax=Bacillus thuringiensis TaxID=1428 RepID=UPI0021554A32|nr:transposase [Bacillus thuringiensis]
MFVLHLKVLSYAFTTANIHDSKMAPVLLRDIQDQKVLFSVADAAYDSQHIYKITRTYDIWRALKNLRFL